MGHVVRKMRKADVVEELHIIRFLLRSICLLLVVLGPRVDLQSIMRPLIIMPGNTNRTAMHAESTVVAWNSAGTGGLQFRAPIQAPS